MTADEKLVGAVMGHIRGLQRTSLQRKAWALAPLVALACVAKLEPVAPKHVPPPPPPRGLLDAFSLHVSTPPHDGFVARSELIEIRGAAGFRAKTGTDLVVAIDLSDSTLQRSGVDLDRDGPRGKTRPGFLRAVTSQGEMPPALEARLKSGLDADDTILAAELEATRALLARIDLTRFRVGLVVFSQAAYRLSPLGGSHARLSADLDRVPGLLRFLLKGTNLADAVDVSRGMLVGEKPEEDEEELEAPELDRTRERVVVLLTDGEPTLPIYPEPQVVMDWQGRLAQRQGVRVFSFPIGPKAKGAHQVLARIAEQTGGTMQPIDHPSEVATELRRLDFVDLSGLEIRNESTGQPAFAVRSSPDGRFEGFVTLASGENRIVVNVTRGDGSRHRAERVVTLGETRDPELGRQRLEALRARTKELEMWAEIEASRRRQLKVLEIEASR